MTKKLSRITAIIFAFIVVIGAVSVPTITVNAQTASSRTVFPWTSNVRTRIEENNAYLKEIIGIDLDTEFNKHVREYEAVSVIPATVDFINIEAIPENPNSIVSISRANNLKEGLNTISISVRAQSGNTMIYRIYVYKEAQNERSYNANLRGIYGINLNEPFDVNRLQYTADVLENELYLYNLYVIPEDEDAMVSVEGKGTMLAVGENLVKIDVTAPDGTLKTYQITVTRPKPQNISSNANLLSISGITLNEPFEKDRFQYTASVPADVQHLNIIAETEDSSASVSINGDQYMHLGDNTITITVRAQDYTRKDYTIKVNRGYVSSNTNIARISGVKLDYEFSNDIDSYHASVPNSVTSVNLDVVPEDENARVAIRGKTNALEVGRNQIQITVTAQSGRRKIVYLTVERQEELIPSSDANIIKLYGDFELNEPFKVDRLNYTIELGKNKPGIEDFVLEIASRTASVEVRGWTASGARLRIRPQTEYYGMRSYSIARIPSGESTITIKVTAADGTKKIYTIRVVKS